jgi:peptidyl-prolyl cis-trans isomerase A (cyclophilin A)
VNGSVSKLVLSAAAILALLGSAPGSSSAEPPPAGSPPAVSSPSHSAAAGEEAVPLPPDLKEGWYAWIDTSEGVIVARLLPEQAPQSVAHFAALAEGKLAWADPLTGDSRKVPYYDGLRVTRAVAGDRIEIGGRTETGRSTPPLYVPPEGESPVDYSAPGRLGMIRMALNRISGVKFFITAGTLPTLNRLHPCFGIVVSGLDAVVRASAVKTLENGTPIEPVTVRKIRVRKVGNPAPLPEPVPYTPKGQAFGPRTGTP